MNFQTKHVTWLFVAAFLLVVAVACGPATPPAESVPATEEEVVPIEEVVEPETEPVPLPEEAEPAAELEPIVVEGALTTESGLQYVEKVAGDGASPEAGDLVTMHFVGTLADGTIFGETYATNEPITVIFGQGQLLPGWEEGVALMSEGGEAQLILPPELGFGEQGFGTIPPNSQLVIDVELLAVEPPPEPAVVDEDDLTTTDSGLMFADLEEGDGPVPEEGGTVSTFFTLWVRGEDGDQFIVSSADQGPISFVVGANDVVFPGWDEGVRTMQEGGKRLLVIPSELGLGEQGGGGIPPGSTLIMEIDLLDVAEPVKMTEVDENEFTETESGLKYFDIVEGDGAMPEQGQTVVVHYSGWLEDGTKFDSSLDRGQPFTFPLGQGSVIAGWDEGVATMKVGGKRQLVIPAELGYGEAGSGLIPPGATLIFDVELVDISQ